MSAQRFRRRPKEGASAVEAMQWFSDRGLYAGATPIFWVQDNGGKVRLDPEQPDRWFLKKAGLEVEVNHTDWVVRYMDSDIKGDFQSWPADLFEATFEPATGPRTFKVNFVLEAVMCDVCDVYFGLPLSFNGREFCCPNRHLNNGRKFGDDK